CMQALEFPLTF
nr:immunoglobulin light chain junction region [Macaca mulatta]MOV77540.1 immunoglobulin light chain junction region [Macaca mulatta]MOV77546.1 immunoglobulin light chain junction region [Macaca mulatta]MOV77559.1 immunoglobulin light chain junction region [Macaca mulatta]MOV77563.1 immunoglobulin light chain junction region [Macaca mulatta]